MLLKTVRLHKYEVRFLLSCVNKLSLWGMAIHSALKRDADLDELILDLRSQSKDNPRMMREILGPTVYDKLIDMPYAWRMQASKVVDDVYAAARKNASDAL